VENSGDVDHGSTTTRPTSPLSWTRVPKGSESLAAISHTVADFPA
jgi:hypothetical protein